MSGSGEDRYASMAEIVSHASQIQLTPLICSRWRGPARQSSQRQSGNGNRDRTGGQGGPRGGNSSWGTPSPAQDQHVPVRGFNAAEAKNALKKGKPQPAVSN